MTDIQDVLREMREDADSPEVRGLDEVMLNRWADAIEQAMREPVAEVAPVIISRKERYTEIRPKRAPASIPGTKLFALPPDAAGEIERLREALEFYADPETYFGIAVIGDPPCGAFADDLSDDHGHPYLDGPRYGKTARAALNTEASHE